MVDGVGLVVGSESFRADESGYRRMAAWFRARGALVRVGVEGCGSYGAGLARYLTAAGIEVVEVTVLIGSYAARGAASPTASTPRGQLGQLPQARLRLFPNPVTAPLSAYGCWWWLAAGYQGPHPGRQPDPFSGRNRS